jgi:hypothetical protein
MLGRPQPVIQVEGTRHVAQRVGFNDFCLYNRLHHLVHALSPEPWNRSSLRGSCFLTFHLLSSLQLLFKHVASISCLLKSWEVFISIPVGMYSGYHY